MSLPELLAGAVEDEDVVARVPLGGDDVLVVTPARTLVYRADGLLSDETVEEYGHDVERIDVSKGRRKSKLTLSYGLDGEETIALPSKRLEDALHPVLAGILSAAGVTEPGESVVRTFRFSELTLVVTSHRLVKHIGGAVWDGDFEEFPYADLTGLDFEEGTVATSVVLTYEDRSERFKAPNESARAVRETLVDAVCEFYGVDGLEEFRLAVAEAAEEDEEAEATDATDFGNGPDPLSASPVSDAEAEAATDAETGTVTDAEAQSPTDAKAEAATDARPEAGGDPLVEGGSTGGSPSSADETTVTGAATGGTGPVDPLAGDPGTESVEAVGGSESPPAGDDGTDGTDESVVEGDAPLATDVDAAADADEPAVGSGDDAFEGSAFESAGIEDEDLTAEVAAIREVVEAQSERLDRQSELIEQLIAELRQGR